MSDEDTPYVFAIPDVELIDGPGPLNREHALVADRLGKAGYDVGAMIWTACPQDYSSAEIRAFWKEAFTRAGITKLLNARDEGKMRTWYMVWPHPSKLVEKEAK